MNLRPLVTIALVGSTLTVGVASHADSPAPSSSSTSTPPAPSSSSTSTPAAPPVVETLRLAQDEAFRVKGEKTFFFRGEFMIDADGAPTAYHPGYTCEASYAKGWKHKAGLDCAARSTQECRARGFKGNVADGAIGDFVRCGTRKKEGKWVCAEVSSTKKRQGGCTMNAEANTLGLDYLANAGEPGNFYGIVTKDGKKTGEPIVQGPKDPAPGFYVSATALVNPKAKDGTVERYVDSSRFNYVALPPSALRQGAVKGDYVAAINWKTGKVAGALFADVGSDSDDDLGEGSIALAKELGIKGSPKGGGGHEDVVYVVFAGTSEGFPTDPARVADTGARKLAAWGGVERLKALVPAWAKDHRK